MAKPMNPGEEFLYWVGSCITAWAKVEEHLFQICAKALGAADERAAIVYYRTPSLDARLNLTDELVRTRFPKPARKSGGHPPPDLKRWDELRKDIGDLLSTRNRIAHHPVAPRTIDTGGIGLLDGVSWLEIYTRAAERLRGRDETTKPLQQDDLVKHRMATHTVRTRLSKFLSETLPKHV